MGRNITALKIQKKDRNRINVYLDGEFAFGLTRIVAAWLKVGQELSEAKIIELQATDAREIAYLKTLKYINYRDRSEKEVRQYLSEKDIPDAILEDVVERLRRNGLIDDLRFAQNWVENRSTFRPRGRRALAYELRQKGIPESILQDVLDQCNEEHLAYLAAVKQSRKIENLEWSDYRKKLSGFLSRRGFGYDTISTILNRMYDENYSHYKDNKLSEIEVDHE